MIAELAMITTEWHEAGRAEFEKKCGNLDYDTYAPKSIIEKRKYYYLDEKDSGAFMVNTQGEIFRIKAYGQVDKRKFVGNVGDVTGQDLQKARWW